MTKIIAEYIVWYLLTEFAFKVNLSNKQLISITFQNQNKKYKQTFWNNIQLLNKKVKVTNSFINDFIIWNIIINIW